MVWIKLDDGFMRCNKVKFAGRDARDLFLAALSHCNRDLTDGFIAEHFLTDLAVDAGIPPSPASIKKCLAKLLAVAPLETNPMLIRVEGGYQIHDYLEYQPSRKDVIESREDLSQKRSEAGKRGMASRWHGKKPGGDGGGSHNKTITNDNKLDNNSNNNHDNKAYQNDNTSITPYPVSPESVIVDGDSLGLSGGNAHGQADAPPPDNQPVKAGPKEPHRAVTLFNERRRLLRGRPATRNAQLEGRMVRLFTDHGETAFTKALDGYFSGLGGSDDFPARKGYDLATFVRQFDTWESGGAVKGRKPAAVAAPPDDRYAHLPPRTAH